MNLLRKSFYTSITHSNKSSSLVPYLFSLTHNHKSTPYSTLTTAKHDRRIHTENVSEYNTVIGLLTAPRRFMSTSKGRSMRSKVEKRMQRETGKTLREMRRAKKLRKKLMTDDERLIYNLRRAKKKASLLLQKLKKYELPDFPPPRHDPELLTPEQLQAYKKIGFRNRNYVPVGVRGVFGGVVQNMHLHWKFHETVQVCCDNFPKEKIKEMATMLARLSGGIVVNIHDVTTVIMFRGRNYRQPKNLIPLNTLTKRKALFKARFEQALESQKLNIKKIEQQLRRKGVNPEDPVHMASIQRVASTFFRAIDEQQGTPYVFKQTGQTGPSETLEFDPKHDGLEEEDSDQEELDRFIKEIEDSADQEWEEEEEREKEEENKVRYWNREDFEYSQRRLDVRRDADRNNEHYDDEDGSEDDRDRERDRDRGKNKPRGNFNKSRDRNERIEFDSGSDSDEDCAKKRGFGRGGLRGSGKRVESDEEVWGIEEDSRDYVRDYRRSGDEDENENENEESNRGSFGVVSERNSDENWDSD